MTSITENYASDTHRYFNLDRIQFIPEELTQRAQWVCWVKGKVKPDGKFGKIPIDAKTGRNASSTNRKTWSPFDVALERYRNDQNIAGIGFVVTPNDDIAGIDLDHCVENGSPASHAIEVMRDCASYAEISPSGHGVRIFGKSSYKLETGINAYHEKYKDAELYTQNRFLTVSGNLIDLDCSQIADITEPFKALAKELRPNGQRKVDYKGISLSQPTGDMSQVRLNEIVQIPAIRRLWKQDAPIGDKSQSDSDFALAKEAKRANISDQETAELMYRWRIANDSVDKEKLNRTDYYQRTISNAKAKLEQESKVTPISGTNTPAQPKLDLVEQYAFARVLDRIVDTKSGELIQRVAFNQSMLSQYPKKDETATRKLLSNPKAKIVDNITWIRV